MSFRREKTLEHGSVINDETAIHDPAVGESNFDIAKNIVTFFQARDSGKYAAIVADKTILAEHRNFHFAEVKYKEDSNVRGKHIIVYKQLASGNVKNFKASTVKSCAKGLIIDNKDANIVKEGLNEVFGNYWSVVKGGTIYCTFPQGWWHELNIDNETWKIWRQS